MRVLRFFPILLALAAQAHTVRTGGNCLPLLLAMASHPSEAAPRNAWRDMVQEGGADLYDDDGFVIEDQSNKAQWVAYLWEIETLEQAPKANAEAIARIRSELLTLAGIRTKGKGHILPLVPENQLITVPLPTGGVNPFPSWENRHRHVINGIEVDGNFVQLPAGQIHLHTGSRFKTHYVENIWVGATPVTQLQWALRMGSNPSTFTGSGYLKVGHSVVDPHRPVETVNADEIETFLRLINLEEKVRWGEKLAEWMDADRLRRAKDFPIRFYQYRLPTEAEWEYAMRARGAGMKWEPSPTDDHAWHAENSGGRPRLVAQKRPNPWGLYDGYGNIAEWTSSRLPNGRRIARGGHFDCRTHPPLTAWSRDFLATSKEIYLGFRLVREDYPLTTPPRVPGAGESLVNWFMGLD